MKEKYEIKVTSKGQLTLPKHLREELALGKGSKVVVELEKDVLTLKPRKGSIVDMLVGLGTSRKGAAGLHEEFAKRVERALG